jgi:hypothetical protein
LKSLAEPQSQCLSASTKKPGISPGFSFHGLRIDPEALQNRLKMYHCLSAGITAFKEIESNVADRLKRWGRSLLPVVQDRLIPASQPLIRG